MVMMKEHAIRTHAKIEKRRIFCRMVRWWTVKASTGDCSDDAVGIIDDWSKRQHEVLYDPAQVSYLQFPYGSHCQPTYPYSGVDTSDRPSPCECRV